MYMNSPIVDAVWRGRERGRRRRGRRKSSLCRMGKEWLMVLHITCNIHYTTIQSSSLSFKVKYNDVNASVEMEH